MPRKDLYELCEFCGGSGSLPGDAKICVDPPGALERLAPKRKDGTYVCPSCAGRCFTVTGLSVGQVERFIRERDELKARLAELEGRRP